MSSGLAIMSKFCTLSLYPFKKNTLLILPPCCDCALNDRLVERSLMVQWVARSIPHGGPLSYFFIPASTPRLVLQSLWYVLSGLWDGACKRALAAHWREYSGGSWFPHSLEDYENRYASRLVSNTVFTLLLLYSHCLCLQTVCDMFECNIMSLMPTALKYDYLLNIILQSIY